MTFSMTYDIATDRSVYLNGAKDGMVMYGGARALWELPGLVSAGWGWLTGAEAVQGLYGPVSRAALEAAANSGGETVRVVTTIDGTLQAGRTLHVATGEGAEALAGAAKGSTTYVANIPKALINLMKRAGLIETSTTSMGGATATEMKFLPQATEFVIKFFSPVN